ncbi:hypothetical protein [Achromobacter kerstersii]|uniref:hypothetical protein n=1 Tax=Achromobacter kerstersii TaxID=1353890 RepID=UPI003D02AE35
MTIISSSGSVQSVAPFSTPITQQRAVDTTVPADAPASTVVRLSQGGADIGASTYTQTGAVSDAITGLMNRNVGTRGLAGPFTDVAAAVLNRFRTDGGNLSLWVPATQTVGATDAATDAVSQSSLRPDNTVSLRINTASGVKVEIALQSGPQGMAVQIEVAEGQELNEDERKAIAGLAGAFQDALDGLAEDPPRWSLARLANASSPLLSSISMRDSRLVAGEVVQTIDFDADSTQRTMTVSGLTGVVKVALDLTKPVTLGSSEQQAAAVNKYLQQVDRAQRRGAGDETLTSTFKDMFSAMHGSYGSAQVPAADGTTFRKPAAEAHRSLLSGLADFSASIEQVRQATNPAQPKETDGFSYQTSQTSSVSGTPRWDLAVSQEQQSTLTASFHRGLTPQTDLKLTTDKDSQTYLYYQIHDTTRSQTDVAYEEGVLRKATLNESRSQTTQVTMYVKGKLIDQTTTPVTESNKRDLLPLVRAAKLEEDLNDPLIPRDQAEETLRQKFLDLARSAASLRQF